MTRGSLAINSAKRHGRPVMARTRSRVNQLEPPRGKHYLMTDETETRPAGASDGGRHPGGGPGEQSPLQARAEFLKNRSWELVVSLNRGACARGGAHHGINSETGGAC